MISGMQIQAGRELLQLTRRDFAEAAGVAVRVIRRMEAAGPLYVRLASLEKVVAALRAGGVEFIPGEPGVRLRREPATSASDMAAAPPEHRDAAGNRAAC
jgi:transcriptional regulator with XRE-family HTH domain